MTIQIKRKPRNPISVIRTGNGDSGSTFFKNQLYWKTDPQDQFVGDLDEACAFLGQVQSLDFDAPGFTKMLNRSQEVLFEIGTMTHSEEALSNHLRNLENYVASLSSFMNNFLAEVDLPELHGFIIPTPQNSTARIARAVIRRAERSAVKANCMWAVPALNIMSDFLFLVSWYQDSSKQWVGFNKSDFSA